MRRIDKGNETGGLEMCRGILWKFGRVCMRDVTEIHTTVCRQLYSAFLCERGCWMYESEVSSSCMTQVERR